MSLQELINNQPKSWLNSRVQNQQVDGNLLVIGNETVQGSMTISGGINITGNVNVSGNVDATVIKTNIISPTHVPNTKLAIQSNGGSNDYVDIQCSQGLQCSPIKTNSIVNTGDIYIVPSGNTIVGNKLLPLSDNSYDIGQPGQRWANVRGENIVCGNIKSDQTNEPLYIQSNGGTNDWVSIVCSDGLKSNKVSAYNTNSNLELSGDGTGYVSSKSDLVLDGGKTLKTAVIQSNNPTDPVYIFPNGGSNDYFAATCTDGMKSDKLSSWHSNSDLLITADGTGKINLDKDTLPSNDGTQNLGDFSKKWYRVAGRYLSATDQLEGNLVTNSILPQNTPVALNMSGYTLGGIDFGLSQLRYHNVKMTDYLSNGILVNTSATVFPANTKTVVTNYTLISGTLPGFNTTTGLYTLPVGADGVYGLQIQIIGSFGALGSSDLIVYVEGGSGTVQVGNTMRMAPDGSAVCYGYQGVNLVLTAGGYNNFRIAVYPKTGSFTGTVGFAFGILYNI